MILYAITDRRLAFSEEGLLGQASRLLRSGVDWLQIREKDLPDGALCAVLGALRFEALRFETRLLVNGRPDLALAAGASGVHLPASGLPTDEVRRLCPPPMFVVRSCHSVKEVRTAADLGADAVTLGPVFDTPSKRAFGAPLGLGTLEEACRAVSIPVLAIGGVGIPDIPRIRAAGAAGLAAIRLFAETPNPSATVADIRRQCPDGPPAPPGPRIF
ncbi:MAG: thiamine phosphate synthase [Acidobacteriota bacterium]